MLAAPAPLPAPLGPRAGWVVGFVEAVVAGVVAGGTCGAAHTHALEARIAAAAKLILGMNHLSGKVLRSTVLLIWQKIRAALAEGSGIEQ